MTLEVLPSVGHLVRMNASEERFRVIEVQHHIKLDNHFVFILVEPAGWWSGDWDEAHNHLA